MLRGPGANVRRPWKLKSGQKSLPRFKKTNVHGARALDRGPIAAAFGPAAGPINHAPRGAVRFEPPPGGGAGPVSPVNNRQKKARM